MMVKDMELARRIRALAGSRADEEAHAVMGPNAGANKGTVSALGHARVASPDWCRTRRAYVTAAGDLDPARNQWRAMPRWQKLDLVREYTDSPTGTVTWVAASPFTARPVN